MDLLNDRKKKSDPPVQICCTLKVKEVCLWYRNFPQFSRNLSQLDLTPPPPPHGNPLPQSVFTAHKKTRLWSPGICCPPAEQSLLQDNHPDAGQGAVATCVFLCTPQFVLQRPFFKHLIIITPPISGFWAAGPFSSSGCVWCGNFLIRLTTAGQVTKSGIPGIDPVAFALPPSAFITGSITNARSY